MRLRACRYDKVKQTARTVLEQFQRAHADGPGADQAARSLALPSGMVRVCCCCCPVPLLWLLCVANAKWKR